MWGRYAINKKICDKKLFFVFARKGKYRNGFSLFQAEGVRGLFQQSGGFFRYAFPRKNQRRAGRKQPTCPRGDPPYGLFRRQKFNGALLYVGLLVENFAKFPAIRVNRTFRTARTV